MKKYLFIVLMAGLVASCSKDKFETIPQVKIKTFGPEQVVKGQLIELAADVTDNEGDVQDSLYVVRKRFNPTTNLQLSVDTIRYFIGVLNVPSKRKFELFVRFLYGETRPEIAPIQDIEQVDRRYSLGLIVVDTAGNRSPYVESDKILLKRL